MLKNSSRFMNIMAVICLCAVFALAIIAAFAPRPGINLPQSTASASEPADRVYATPSGTKYHRRSCATIEDSDGLKGFSPIAARREGYSPCQVCEP